MIEFRENFRNFLPYDRNHYIEFLCDDCNSIPLWYGVSFQLDSAKKPHNSMEFAEKYEYWFKKILLRFDDNSSWIVNHDKVDQDWFPNDEDNLTSLRTLFLQNNILNSFKGALIFNKCTLLKFYKDLMSYPYAVYDEEGLFYTNLDISFSELPLILKISDHLNVDLLTNDKQLLRNFTANSFSDDFIIKEYRGTFL